MKRAGILQSFFVSLTIITGLIFPLSAFAQTAVSMDQQIRKQSVYPLDKKFLTAENEYLAKYPDLQDVMDAFYAASLKDLGDAKGLNMNIAMTHTRIVAAIMLDISKSLPVSEQRLAFVTALLHDVDKMNPKDSLTDPAVFIQVKSIVDRLKAKGYFQDSPNFFTDEKILTTPGIGDTPSLIHNLTGPLRAEKIMDVLGYSADEIEKVEVAILEHSTQYWYFKDQIDKQIGKSGAWEDFYPKTVTPLGMAISDADNLAQLMPDSIIPQDSKWRELARNRWGGKGPVEEGQIIYYVLQQMVGVQLTDEGKKEGEEYWNVLRPQLIKLMGLDPKQSPIAVLGIPKYWSDSTSALNDDQAQNPADTKESIFDQPTETGSGQNPISLGLKILIGAPVTVVLVAIGGIFFYAVKKTPKE